jgi:hypothetical protein
MLATAQCIPVKTQQPDKQLIPDGCIEAVLILEIRGIMQWKLLYDRAQDPLENAKDKLDVLLRRF